MQTGTPDTNILVWLPSPMGDAILSTPALRAIRDRFKSSKIWFLANPAVRELLSPGTFNDGWIECEDNSPVAIAGRLRQHCFSHAILFKNSFGSALAAFLARIPARIGYARDKRGLLLTDRLRAPKSAGGRFKPRAMVDYYLAIASCLGAETSNRSLYLPIEPQSDKSLTSKLPELADSEGPVVVVVPGGAFGPSKCWPEERFAETADRLIRRYRATVVISVAPAEHERQIARRICDSSEHELISLAERPLGLNELKALFSKADLVVTNDTGPRHIAVAFGRKVVTLFGPNDPAWTDTEWDDEIQIVGNVPCAPCGSPECRESRHLCMESITVEMVCEAATKLLEGNRRQAIITTRQAFTETPDSLFLDPDYESSLRRLGLTSINAVFSFESTTNLVKDNLAGYRSRAQFEMNTPGVSRPTTAFLKRYDQPPIRVQLRNWLCAHTRTSCGVLEFTTASRLTTFGINTPKTICYGEQWSGFFEKRSFIMTEKIPDAESLERRLPECFAREAAGENLHLRRAFVVRLADFVKKFHETGYRHRDLYFAHIFYSNTGEFHLIDLARAFKPLAMGRRFQIKDIAQLHYSAPSRHFSNTDRMRFHRRYTGRQRLSAEDKQFIRKVMRKAKRMARHNTKHGRPVPFEN